MSKRCPYGKTSRMVTVDVQIADALSVGFKKDYQKPRVRVVCGGCGVRHRSIVRDGFYVTFESLGDGLITFSARPKKP